MGTTGAAIGKEQVGKSEKGDREVVWSNVGEDVLAFSGGGGDGISSLRMAMSGTVASSSCGRDEDSFGESGVGDRPTMS